MALGIVARLRSRGARVSDAILVCALAACCAGSTCSGSSPDAQAPDGSAPTATSGTGSCCGAAGPGQAAPGAPGSSGTPGSPGKPGNNAGSPCQAAGAGCDGGGVLQDGGVAQDAGVGQDASVVVPSTATVIASGRITQDWGAAAWSQPSITFANVQAGDAIIVLGMYWDASHTASTAPGITGGAFVAAVNQAPAFYNAGPPVYSQIFYMLNATAGTHAVTAPNIGGGEGDGTLYAFQVRGISSVVMTGSSHAVGSAIPNVSTALAGSAHAGDFLIAIGGYDNSVQFASAQISNAPAGWVAGGVQNDASNNVPSEVCYRTAPALGTQSVTWSWADPAVNVTATSIAAFR